jgi:Zn-dependent peptidase ImmA (M78 family)
MPTFVMVYGRKIPIRYINKDQLNEHINGAEGLWDTYTRQIYINKEAPKCVQYYYIYHEMGHAVLTYTGLDQILSAELQEVIVQSFATMFEDVVKQKNKFK